MSRVITRPLHPALGGVAGHVEGAAAQAFQLDGLRVFMENLAGVDAADAVRGAVQQLRAGFFLKLAQLLGQRRLRHVQHQRCPRQGPVIDDGKEITELS